MTPPRELAAAPPCRPATGATAAAPTAMGDPRRGASAPRVFLERGLRRRHDRGRARPLGRQHRGFHESYHFFSSQHGKERLAAALYGGALAGYEQGRRRAAGAKIPSRPLARIRALP